MIQFLLRLCEGLQLHLLFHQHSLSRIYKWLDQTVTDVQPFLTSASTWPFNRHLGNSTQISFTWWVPWLDISWALPTPSNVTDPENSLDVLFPIVLIAVYHETMSQQPVSHKRVNINAAPTLFSGNVNCLLLVKHFFIIWRLKLVHVK